MAIALESKFPWRTMRPSCHWRMKTLMMKRLRCWRKASWTSRSWSRMERRRPGMSRCKTISRKRLGRMNIRIQKNTANEEEAESDATVVLVTEDIEDEEFEKKIEGVMKYEKKKRKLYWEGGQGAEEGYEEGDAAQVSQDKGRKEVKK